MVNWNIYNDNIMTSDVAYLKNSRSSRRKKLDGRTDATSPHKFKKEKRKVGNISFNSEVIFCLGSTIYEYKETKSLHYYLFYYSLLHYVMKTYCP